MPAKRTKDETYLQILAAFLERRDETALRAYIVENSHLPGPRANLELASAFADVAAQARAADREWLWSLCESWTSTPAAQALPNDPREFLVFCGTRGLGGIGSASSDFGARALPRLHDLSSDARWRTREAVAMALQDLLRARPDPILAVLETWIRPGTWFEMRAVAAGLAEPPLLKDARIAKAALDAHRRILGEVGRAGDRSAEAFKVLRQGLGYTVSVVVAARPREGFAWLKELARSDDPDIQGVLRENLKKTRLVAAFPREVAQLETRRRDQSP